MIEAWRWSVLSNGLMGFTDWMLALAIFAAPLTAQKGIVNVIQKRIAVARRARDHRDARAIRDRACRRNARRRGLRC